ncbi:MAG TPA: AMP-binding protein [Terriglobales bacterium]|jgi:long-chain acyl-CoA synthetase|nr:AMP-binding protein [Terriglobales bacterium]
MPTFYDRFRECAERWPQNRALEIQRRDRTESYTYAETRQKAESVGRWLVENGFQSGARLAILADNHPRWVAAYLGAIAAGCTAVPLDTAFRVDQVAKLLKDSGSSLLFADAKNLPIAQSAVAELDIPIVLVSGGESSPATPAGEQNSARAGQKSAPTRTILAQPVANLDSIFASGPGNFTPVESSTDNLASLLYTSGTTADPKGVMLTHANLLGEVESVFARLDIGPDDAVLGVLPLFHVLSQMANLLLPLVKGARVVYLETLNTTELLRALQERQITAFAVVPQFFYLIHDRIFKEIQKRGSLARRALRALMTITRFARRLGWNTGRLFFRPIHKTFGDKMRYLITGGSRFDPQIGRDFYALGIDVLQAYGLTETTGAAFLTVPKDNVIGSVGPPLPGVEGKIIDPRPQEEGGPATGEIAIRGAVVMKGYWNRPEATAAVLKNGWLLTGDLGHFDARSNLVITGRKKDVIVLSNGKNIYPEEIEAHYSKSPYIKEMCVMGLEAKPGDPTSERLHAVIVPNFEMLKRQRISNAKEVIRFDIETFSAQVPSTKRIGSYEIWPEDLPHTTTRKLKRFEIEKRVRANQARGQSDDSEVASERPLSADDTAWLEQPEVQGALKIVRESAKSAPDVIRPGDNLELDLGFDSMQRVELLVTLEEELGGDVEESRLADIYTVRELVDTVRESAASGKTASRTQAGGWRVLLQQESTDPEVLALASPGRFAEHVFYVLSRLIEIFASDRLSLCVSGLEKLPGHGPYIISSNHQSFVDPVILSSVLPWSAFRDLFSGGTSEIFGSGPMRVLARWLRVMVLDPDANLVSAMRAGIFGLRHGRIMILYPEGERSIDGTPRIFKKGAAILSIHAQVPIVPVAIEGFYEVWPRGKKFFQKFAPVRMRFGDPIYPPPESEASEATYERLTAELRARVLAMWEELRAERR